MHSMCLQGSLDDFSIQDVLQIISLGRKTGWLSIDTPSGGGAIVFRHGRVLASLDDDLPPGPASGRAPEEELRERIAASVGRVARCRSGEFSFQVSAAPPLAIGGRDVAAESLRSGLDVVELLIEVACRQDESDADETTPPLEAREAS